MTFSKSFYRAAALGSFLSVATTLLLIFLPRFYGPIGSFEQRMQVVHEPLWLLRAWTYLLHPFVVFAAALGVAAALRRVASGAMTAGLLGFLVWAFTEAAQQALTLVAFRRWAIAFGGADAGARKILHAQIATYDAVWDAMFLLLLIGFLIGNAFYGAVLIRRPGFDRILGAFFVGIALLTAAGISGELGGPVLPSALGPWLYPTIQPLARVLIGAWLWRAGDSPPAP